MDNVTHSLAGVVLARWVTPPEGENSENPSTRWKHAVLWAGILGSNLPDFDFLLNPISGFGKISYLLQHRGYTHTLVVTVLLGILLGGILSRVYGWKGKPRMTLILLSILSGWTHIGMDFWNNYGVHPFWPIHNQWFYGDTIFIIEPLLWITLGTLTLKGTYLKKLKGFYLFCLIGLAGLMVFGPFLKGIHVTFVFLIAGFWIYFLKKSSIYWTEKKWGFICILVIWGGFSVFGQYAKAIIRSHATPGYEWVDFSKTPVPSHPLCWRTLTLERKGDELLSQSSWISVIPSLISARMCSEFFPRYDSDEVLSESPQRMVQWAANTHISDLIKWDKNHCDFHAFLAWSRFPYWKSQEDRLVWFSDLRYKRKGAPQFASSDAGPADANCDRFIPGWTPVRSDLLSAKNLDQSH
ncbi:MAG: hypothetical protein CL678_07345 [Bdellovibrionaceae bacterium]|nr:hypothetical protein [Pseudobdellovibrionaceae bacterium]|tara:strand:+ start:653 stop:1882 length:1230 start_codon:yes stop_codon:yes gene_type:complete